MNKAIIMLLAGLTAGSSAVCTAAGLRLGTPPVLRAYAGIDDDRNAAFDDAYASFDLRSLLEWPTGFTVIESLPIALAAERFQAYGMGAFVDDQFGTQFLLGPGGRLASLDTGSGALTALSDRLQPADQPWLWCYQTMATPCWSSLSWDATTRTLFAIAIDPWTAPYSSRIYTIDPVAGDARPVGEPLPGTIVRPMAIDPHGRMVGYDELSGRLLEIDKRSGAYQVIGELDLAPSILPGGLLPGADLGFSADGTLWLVATKWDAETDPTSTRFHSYAFTLDRQTARGTLAGDAGFVNVHALSIAEANRGPDVLFAEGFNGADAYDVRLGVDIGEPAPTPAGQATPLQLRLSNFGSGEIVLTEPWTITLPASVEVADVPAVHSDCPDAFVRADAGASQIEVRAGVRVRGELTCTIEFAIVATEAGQHTIAVPEGSVRTQNGGNGSTATTVFVAGPALVSPVLYDQIRYIGEGGGAYAVRWDAGVGPGPDWSSEGADDFSVDGAGWTITEVQLIGGAASQLVDMAIYPDVGGLPGDTPACALPATPFTYPPDGPRALVSAPLSMPCTLAPGDYWLGVSFVNDYAFWQPNLPISGRQAVWRNPGGAVLAQVAPCPTWNTLFHCLGAIQQGKDFSFRLLGTRS